MAQDKKHLKVVGTSLRQTEIKHEVTRLMGDIPLVFDFDNPGGEALFRYVHDKVEIDNLDMDTLVAAIGLGDTFVDIYNDWRQETYGTNR